MRRFGNPPVKGVTYKIRHGAYAVIRRGRDLLITEQEEPFPEFQLPGGGIDPGESPIQALHREAYEETGWTIAIERRLGVYSNFTYMPEYDLCAHKVCHIYLCRPVIRKSDPIEPMHTAVWMTPETAIAQLGSDGDRAFVQSLRL